ncbi:barstar family protein [Microtetraspora sp. AC03309]|uniref:barstar family protein n=1 Tax=Microtetraspora sp. AC03309 TaxID=2779376 RepID=UPI001E5DE9EE|nr:barstar family protein [Microtetraspora sp. AC03309]
MTQSRVAGQFTKAPTGMGVAAAIRQARLRGATPHVLDGSGAPSSAAMLESIARLLDFPEDFGHNFDALYDCLTDLSWLPAGEHVLVWSKPSVLRRADPTAYDALGSLLSDAVGDGASGKVALSVIMLAN